MLESTYGNKNHGNIGDSGKMLLEIMLETLDCSGNIIILTFAVWRTQKILYKLNPFAGTRRE